MKRLIFIIIVLILVIYFFVCGLSRDNVLDSLGKYSSKQYFTDGGVRDYVDYAKYKYDNVDFSDNDYFKIISEKSREDFEKYIRNFESLVNSIAFSDPNNELVKNYDFDSGVISESDYIYIFNDPDHPKFGLYKIYYFDMESNILFCFSVHT